MANRETFLAGKSGLVPSIRLFQERVGSYGASEKIIGDTSRTFQDTQFGKNDIVGLSNVEIKYGQGYISCEVEFPMSQQMLLDAQSHQASGEVYEIFSIINNWKIEFGWGGGPKQLISGMKLVKWDISYDANKRMFITKLRFVPGNGLILGDIKMAMLTDTNRKIRDACEKQAKGIKLSLGTIISEVLDECRKIIRDRSYNGIERDQLPIGVASPQNQLPPYVSSIKYFQSDILKFAVENDVPDPDNIMLVLFGDPNKDSLRLSDVYDGFLHDNFSNYTMIDKITDDNNVDLSVYSFISSLLDDNGFMIMPRPGTTDKDSGRILWMIMQSEFNNIGSNIEEVEYKSIRPHVGEVYNSIYNSSSWVSNTPQLKTENLGPVGIPNQPKEYTRLIQTFGGGENSKNRQLFDLHSNRNIVLSVNASTEHGQTTLPSLLANDAAAKYDSRMVSYKDSIFELISKQSKEINLETIGFQELNPGDNIYVNLGGELFSGRYKVVEMSHKIGSNFTTDIRAIRTISGDTRNNIGRQPDVEPTEDLSFSKILAGNPEDANDNSPFSTHGRTLPFGPK